VNTVKTIHTQVLQNTVHLIQFVDEIKLKRFRWAGRAAHTIKINAHRILVRKPKEKDQLEDLGVFLEEHKKEVWYVLTRGRI
jgi:hypothetical protein